MKVNMDVLMKRIEEIYSCGLQEDGTHTRMAYSEEDRRGKSLYLSYAKNSGLSGRMDEAGNLFVRLEGKEALPAILMGSHLDTVPDGGKYDGVLGSLAALGVLEAYVSSGTVPRHPLEAAVYTDEEGFRFGTGLLGSTAICGLEKAPDGNETDIYGKTRKEVMEEAGLSPERTAMAKRDPDDIFCTLELHIEQGGVLDREGIPVGVVSAIAGVSRFEITVTGQANHAGSTMMTDRKDALVAASRLIGEVPDVVRENGNAFTVATVGTIQVTPHSVNVIPGTCTFSLEIRDQTGEGMRRIRDRLFERMDEICTKQGVEWSWKETLFHDPAPMSELVTGAEKKALADLGYPYMELPSGAFHDSLIMSGFFPTGMIFVPSEGGISHSREEFTRPDDMEKGCDVLLAAVQELDRM